jgi:hypothetical protein
MNLAVFSEANFLDTAKGGGGMLSTEVSLKQSVQSKDCV